MRRALPLAAGCALAGLATLLRPGPAASQAAPEAPREAVLRQAVDDGGDYFPLSPERIVDTRSGLGIARALGPGQSADVLVIGVGGVPASNVRAVVVNATVTNTSAAGYLTLHPSGTALPTASNLNWLPGETVPNLVTVKVGPDGRVRVFNSSGTTDVILDVNGWYSDGSVGGGAALVPTDPGREYDSRLANDPIPAQQAKVFEFAPPSVAGGSTALVFNVTVTEPAAAGYVTVGPGNPGAGAPLPAASNLNFAAGRTVANAVIARKDSAGKVFAYSSTRAHIILDQVGRFVPNPTQSPSGRFVSLPPARILDTREGLGRPRGFLPQRGAVPVTVTGVGGVPAAGVGAVLLNVTVTEPLTAGYLSIWPAGSPQPEVSTINFSPGQTVANLALVKVGAAGQVNLYNQSTAAHAIFDVVGWYRA